MAMCGCRLLQLRPYIMNMCWTSLCCRELYAEMSQPRWGLRGPNNRYPCHLSELGGTPCAVLEANVVSIKAFFAMYRVPTAS
jgi:hypothetical protein